MERASSPRVPAPSFLHDDVTGATHGRRARGPGLSGKRAPSAMKPAVHLLALVARHRLGVRGLHQRVADIAQVPGHRRTCLARISGGDRLENSLVIPQPDRPVILHAHMGVDLLPDAGIALRAPERVTNQHKSAVARGFRQEDVETVIRGIGFAALGMLMAHHGERIGQLGYDRLRGALRRRRRDLRLDHLACFEILEGAGAFERMHVRQLPPADDIGAAVAADLQHAGHGERENGFADRRPRDSEGPGELALRGQSLADAITRLHHRRDPFGNDLETSQRRDGLSRGP